LHLLREIENAEAAKSLKRIPGKYRAAEKPDWYCLCSEGGMQIQGVKIPGNRRFVFRPVIMLKMMAKRLTINPLERVGSKA